MTTEDQNSSWTIGKLIAWSSDYLKDRGMTDTPRLDAELLLAHALGCTRMQLYTGFDKPLTVAERDPFRDFLRRRSGGEPVAYIVGNKEFMSLSFLVTRDVLIPRPDTEVLVEAVLAGASARGADAPALDVLDVGTGSGCIAISLALKLKGAQVTAWDDNEQALTLARANAERLSAPSISFQAMDALSDDAWSADERYDVIVSNPPYIAEAEARALPVSVRDFEPQGALFAAADGLAFYQTYARLAPQLLKPDGRIYCEVGSTQGEAVKSLLTAAGWRDATVLKDYGRLDRVVTALRPEGEGRL